MRRQPELARVLERLLRVAEDDGREIGRLLAAHTAEVVQLLGVEHSVISQAAELPDGALAPKIRGELARLKEHCCARRDELDKARAEAGAQLLAANAIADRDRIAVDAKTLLGQVLADRTSKSITFLLPAGVVVAVERGSLLGTARAIGHRSDLAAWIDSTGVHVRWRAGRGGLNWLPQHLPATERARSLVVDLSHVVPARKALPQRPPSSRWSWDVLADLCAAS